jgi:poly(hydroxyalkanoate) granule-associated protein
MNMANESGPINDKKPAYTFFDVARRIVLASIGAIAITHDEMEEFIDKLVDRGEIAKKDGEKLLKEVREKRGKHLGLDESRFQHRIEELLDRMKVPAKKDFDELNAKLSAVEEKIDELMSQKNQTP